MYQLRNSLTFFGFCPILPQSKNESVYMSVTVIDVKKIAALANLEFNDTDLEKYTHQLNGILEYVDKLNEIDTSSVDETYHPIRYEDAFRNDEIGESLPIDKVLQNAPEKTWQYFVVPKVVGS